MIEVFSPGVRWYADEIASGKPFSLIRFGDILRIAVPTPLPRYDPDHKNLSREVFRIWAQPDAERLCNDIVLGTHRRKRYWPAVWHQDNLERRGWSGPIESWLSDNGLLDLTWHDGGVWKRAVEQGEFHIIIKALREQPLPIVLVGPHRIYPAARRLDAYLVPTPLLALPDDTPIIQASVLSFPSPAVLCFAASIPGKAVIQRLFPIVGHHSYLIDFGSVWDALCGHKERMYQKELTDELIERNWEGS